MANANTVLTNLSSTIPSSAATLASLFGTSRRAGRYKQYRDVVLTNRGDSDLTIYAFDASTSADASHSNTLASGESVLIEELNTNYFAVKGVGDTASDSLDFQGEPIS